MILSEKLGVDISYIILGMLGVMILLFIFFIVFAVKLSKVKKNYNKFMSGANAESLETVITERFAEIDGIKKQIEAANGKITGIQETLLSTYQKIGIIKYDAFKEMGGKLSFALALLNETNDGFIINSMHSSREGCYTYVKEIIKGESFIMLADEEKEALDVAVKSKSVTE